jgi:hypothetical protein
MDCRFLGVEGFSEFANVSGVRLGDRISLRTPTAVLCCQSAFFHLFDAVIGPKALQMFEPSASMVMPSTPLLFQAGPTVAASSLPHPSPGQVSKFSEFKHLIDVIDPGKLGEFFSSADHSANTFDNITAIMLARRAHDSFSSGLVPCLLPVSDSELWALVCMSFGSSDKSVSIKRFRPPNTDDPSTCGGVLDCLRTLAAVIKILHGDYLFGLMSHLQATLSTLITSNASRFNGAHLLSICDKVFAALKLCSGDTAAERMAKHASIFEVTETTHYVAKHLRDETWRAPTGTTTPSKGKRSLDNPAPDPVSKKGSTVKGDKAKAYAAWLSLEPITGQDICRNWAAGRGDCAKGKNKCTRKHAYPASTWAADKLAFADWAKSMPK